MPKTGVVLGLGQIGTAVARAMLAAGWSVRGLRQDTSALPDDLAPVELTMGDRNDDADLARVMGDGADGVVDTIAYNSTHARQLLAYAGAMEAVAVVSSAAVYVDDQGNSINHGEPTFPVPITESAPLVAATDDTYGGGKVMLERILLDAGHLPVTSIRPMAVCGPNSRHLREWWLIKRALDGRRVVPLKYGGRSRFHPTSTANIAALALHSLGLTGSQILNVADPDCPNVHEIATLVSTAMSHEWRLVPLPDERSDGPVGETPWTTPHPLVLDTSRATAIGYQPATTYAEAMPALVRAAITEVGEREWREVYPVLAGYPGDQYDYAAEDRLLQDLELL
jgi:nucleoside-diphosphate-sugar epimerase